MMHAKSNALIIAATLAAFVILSNQARADGDKVSPVFSAKLANVPGHTLSVLKVEYPPGGVTQKHHHAGAVFAYVLSGSIRSQNSATGPVRIYKAGESFFEPPGSEHLVSQNASKKRSASLLAVFIAEDGAGLKTDDK
jgi:quercetin dioxygenase-like cupin family protein